MFGRRDALGLAAVLAATVMTAGVAAAGLAHGSHHRASPPQAARVVVPPRPGPARGEEAD
jgi:hypothetical protein